MASPICDGGEPLAEAVDAEIWRKQGVQYDFEDVERMCKCGSPSAQQHKQAYGFLSQEACNARTEAVYLLRRDFHVTKENDV